MIDLPPMWVSQREGFESFYEAKARGQRRLCLFSPTGGGKTRIGGEISKTEIQAGKRVAWYTNRKLLLEQTAAVFQSFSITSGIRAAGNPEALHHAFQICSVQTEARRARRSDWNLHEADLAIFDEAHAMKGENVQKIQEQHIEKGAMILGLSASPVDLADYYDELIIAGRVSELIERGNLVKAIHYGPDEPDLTVIDNAKRKKKVDLFNWSPDPAGEDFSEAQQRKVMGSVDKGMQPDKRLVTLYGRVYGEWCRLNPERKPTLLFAPGVNESVWFMTRFADMGIRAAHIDGDNIAINEPKSKSIDWLDANTSNRAQLIEDVKSGRIVVLCNRFVLREGIDLPEASHIIIATIFGALTSYIQTGGRGMRCFPGKEHLIVQDHGGNWWRHGSFNEDRPWDLSFTNHIHAGLRADSFREKRQREPRRCPKCAMIRIGLSCPCGYTLDPQTGVKARPVITTDGRMIELQGDIYKPRRRLERADTVRNWTSVFCALYSAKGGTLTFRQAEGWFAQKFYHYPPLGLALMPREPVDWYRPISEVPTDRLNGAFDGTLPGWINSFRDKRDAKLQTEPTKHNA